MDRRQRHPDILDRALNDRKARGNVGQVPIEDEPWGIERQPDRELEHVRRVAAAEDLGGVTLNDLRRSDGNGTLQGDDKRSRE